MTTDEKLVAILAAIQSDPGNRGLARDPVDNLFTACKSDFAAACLELANHPTPIVHLVTGFFIASAEPPCFETDGPLGAAFVAQAFHHLGINTLLLSEPPCAKAMEAGIRASGIHPEFLVENVPHDGALHGPWVLGNRSRAIVGWTHTLAIERSGPATDGKNYTMRGRDISEHMLDAHVLFQPNPNGKPLSRTIGIGDGGNEIGMGKIPHETMVKNIPNGNLIHCRVPTDHLIVAGVSNWGAYALAAGIFVVRGVKPPAGLFDADREREILEVMVREGPLVDGVTGKQTATVDGLSWEDYVKPLNRIREILES